FFQSDCEYCLLQAPLVKMLAQSEGFAVVPISMDGQPLPNHLFPNVRADSGQAKRLGIVTYPAVYLASPAGEFAPVGQGLMSLPELNHRILIAAKRSGWISETEFNQTRPLLNIQTTNIAAHLSLPDREEDSFIPPQQLMHEIQAQLE